MKTGSAAVAGCVAKSSHVPRVYFSYPRSLPLPVFLVRGAGARRPVSFVVAIAAAYLCVTELAVASLN